MDRKEQIIKLWTRCFNDPEAFVQLFFDQVYKEEYALTIEREGQVVSALQMLPYTMTYLGTEIPVSYIYGACTAPEARDQGLMRQLLQQAFDVMKRRNVALTVLIPAEPWLFDYYRKLGYTEAFDYTLESYTRPSDPVQAPTITVVTPQEAHRPALYDFFNRKMRERACCIQHTYANFTTILQDLRQGGGQTWAAFDRQERVVGLLLLYPTPEGRFIARELLSDTDVVKALLLQEATAQNGVSQLSYLAPPKRPGTLPLGMACVIDADRLIPHWLSKHPDSSLSKADMEKLDVQSLTRVLLGYPDREAYMNLMLN